MLTEKKQFTEGRSSSATEQERRRTPIFKSVQPVAVSVGRSRFQGYAYDIGEEGLSFVTHEDIPMSFATVQVAEFSRQLQGRILEQLSADGKGLKRYRLQFNQSIDMKILHELLD